MDDPALPRAFGFRVAGDPPLLVLMNGEAEPRRFVFPEGGPWRSLLPGREGAFDGELELAAYAVAVLEGESR